MSFSQKYIKTARWLLPMPFTIAIILTFISFIFSALNYEDKSDSFFIEIYSLMGFWEKGLWNTKLLSFALQMMLMLVLGHVLASTKAVNKIINYVVKKSTSNAKAVIIVSTLTIIVSWLNWGLGLIFGAILARKVGEYAKKSTININYPLIGACAYMGLMVWHGGLSGSAPLKVAEKGHFFEDSMGVVFLSETIFSAMNLYCSLCLLIILPLSAYLLSKNNGNIEIPDFDNKHLQENQSDNIIGAEMLDNSNYFGKLAGLIILRYISVKLINSSDFLSLRFLNPDFINLSLFSIGLILHDSLKKYMDSVQEAIIGAAGILIQFPLYFGIMGLMSSSGLIEQISSWFIEISNQKTYTIYTFISAGIVNVFVPSGGGQWAIQGPVIIEAAKSLNVSLSKSIMAMAYGDQLTNMLQPFWALPLLGITKLKAKDILPYTLFFMLVGALIFISFLLIF